MKILLAIDVINWAWAHKAKAIKKHLKDEFEAIDIVQSKKFKKNKGLFSKYNHIHWFGWLEGASWAKKYNGVSAGVSSHNYYYRHFDVGKNKMNRYNALTCTSKIIFEDLKKKGIGKKLYICQNGVDEEMFQPDPIKHDKFVVGWMGQPTKGGFSRSDKSIDMHGYQHVVLPLAEKLKENKGVEFKVLAKTYKNAMPHADMVKWYNGLDLFIHTGFGTGTPNPVFEAMACGVPCISTSIGAAPEVIKTSRNGLLVPRFFDKKEAMDVMIKTLYLISYMETQREIVKDMGVRARKTIEDSWTWKQRARSWIPVFKNHGKVL